MNPRDYGVHIFHGCPGCGKTEAALGMCLRARKSQPTPAMLIIDPQRAYNFANFAETTPKLIWDEIYTKRLIRKITPSNEDEFDWIMRGVCGALTDTLVIIDEMRHYANSHYVSRNFSLACRQYRHCKLGLYLTTQHLSDIHAEITSCRTRIYHYKSDSPRILDRVEREYGIARERIVKLGVGQCIIQSGGFENVHIPK